MTERWQQPLREVARTPMSDALLDEARRGPRFPEPGPRTSSRVLAAAVAIVVALAAALLIRPALEPTPGTSYRNYPMGWMVTIPPGWQQIHFKVSGQVSRPPVAELVHTLSAQMFIANQAASSMDGRRIASAGEVDAVPAGGVLVSIAPSGPTRVADATGDDYGYPSTPTFNGAASNDAPETHTVQFQADGLRYNATATFGAGASDADRRTAEAIVASIVVPGAPPAPAEGTAVARFPGTPLDDAWRIGPPQRFPAGTVKRLRVEPPGVFHPRVLFIVTPDHPVDGQAHWMFMGGLYPPCKDLRWDGRLFTCGHRTWRSNGMPVGGRFGTRLPRFLVLETWEGQLIASTQQLVNGG